MSCLSVDRPRWRRLSSEHFLKVAPRYDAGRNFERGEFWAGEIAARVELGPGDWLLDLGCGTGLFTVPFAQRLPCSVLGLDPSPAMLASAAARPAAASARWLRATGGQLPLGHNSLKGIFLSQVWHHLEDGMQAAREFYRALRPGGVLLVKTYSHCCAKYWRPCWSSRWYRSG